jgi:hypothetical protein
VSTLPVPDLEGAVAYDAPFLIDKLLKDQIVQSRHEAEELFGEVKRYIVFTRVDTSKDWDMYSLRVDEVWHQFILYTAEYSEYCHRFLGRYVHHKPGNAPEPPASVRRSPASFSEFRTSYEEYFGRPLPEVWDDSMSVTMQRRAINDRAGRLTVRRQDDVVELINAEGEVLFSVNELAFEAISFIAGLGAFYVRELPGNLTPEEKVALVSVLVGSRLLRVAP